nr:hypothetical protein [uncultured Oscillibacter sp.]
MKAALAALFPVAQEKAAFRGRAGLLIRNYEKNYSSSGGCRQGKCPGGAAG